MLAANDRGRHVRAWSNLVAAACNEASAAASNPSGSAVSRPNVLTPVPPSLIYETMPAVLLSRWHAAAERETLERISSRHVRGAVGGSIVDGADPLALDEEAQLQTELRDVRELETFVAAERERQRMDVHHELSEAVLRQLLVEAVEALPRR